MKFGTSSIVVMALALFMVSCLDSEDPNAQLNKETKAIDEYLAANNTDYVAYDASGMRVVIKAFGNDAPPHSEQHVNVTYTAKTFPDGNVFDEGEINEKIDDITIPGLQRGIASILEGTHAMLYIPSKYAFGSSGTTVPPNTTVVYDITLNEVTRTPAEQTQYESDTTYIHQYITDHEITATKLPSGVWYTITAEGTGASPKPYDVATIGYKGILMSNGDTFDEGTLPSQGLFLLIDGLKLGIPEMKEGGSAKFYIPSGYAYGEAGVSGHVGSNANLIFEISLTDIVQ